MQSIAIKDIKPNQRRFTCLTCGCGFVSKKADKNRTPKYCGKPCYAQSLIKPKQERKEKVSRKGIPLSAEWRQALSEGRKKSEKCRGESLYNWKGGQATLAERMRLHANKRRSAQKIEIDADFMQRLLAVQGNRCFYCECDITQYKAIEHLTPLSRGGDNDKYNMVYACKSCNSKKRNKTLEEFAILNRRFDWIDKFDSVFPEALYG